jgi:hypothetical protein
LTKVARSTLQRADWPIGQRISDNSDKLAGHASQPTASDQVAEGETARLTKGLEVVVRLVEPGRALVASSDPAAEREGTPPFDVSWAFVLEPEGPSGTRLVMRARYAWTRWRAGLLAKALAWGGFVLSRSMLVNAKRHAEELWRQELAARSAESYSGSGLDAQTTSANLSVSAAQMTVAGSDTPSTGTDLSTKAAGRPKLKPTDPVS